MKRILKILSVFFVSCLLFLYIIHINEASAKSFSVIRDTEIEEVTLTYVRDIFQKAGLNAETAQIVFLNDDSINAFVAGGTLIFIHTGLLMQSDSPDAFIGVLAHETGHIAGGHVARSAVNLKKTQQTALISTLLGGLATVLSGRPDVGIAVLAGSAQSNQALFSSYRQSEEQIADSAAVSILKQTPYSIQGLAHIMEKIRRQEQLSLPDDDSSYLRTHPLSSQRLSFLRQESDKEKKSLQKDPSFFRIKAKLSAFMQEPESVLKKYNSNSFPDRYARAIAYFRSLNIDKAMALLNDLIKEEPSNPYLYELKGQVLFETGKTRESLFSYKKAVELKPEAVLIRLAYAHALVETGEKQNAREALLQYRFVNSRKNDFSESYKGMATAYSILEEKDKIPPLMAEYYLNAGDYSNACRQANIALKTLKEGTPQWLRMKDISEIKEKETK